MHFPDFKLLSLPMQAHHICQQGVYLSERSAGDYYVALYSLFDFYAEVHYRFADSEVIMITSFHDTHLLTPYLDKINLQWLLQPSLHLNT
jgi:hypothetical protein